MALYKSSKSGDIDEIKEASFLKEKELQNLVENNLDKMFGLVFIRSEFELHNLRIDTLAYDEEANSFVIIEYKRDKNFSVVDQGLSYLSLMLNNKADFVIEYAKRTKTEIDKIDIDWTQARVVFIARSFSVYQQNAINFKDFPIELYEAIKYDNDSVLINKIESSTTEASIKSVTKNTEVAKVTREVRKYSEKDVIIPGYKGEQLYRKLKEKMEVIAPNFQIHPTKRYLSFRMPDNWRNILNISFRQEKLIIDLLRSQPEDFKDPEKRVEYAKNSYKYFRQHISKIEIKNEEDVEYAAYIIQQLYERFLKDNSK